MLPWLGTHTAERVRIRPSTQPIFRLRPSSSFPFDGSLFSIAARRNKCFWHVGAIHGSVLKERYWRWKLKSFDSIPGSRRRPDLCGSRDRSVRVLCATALPIWKPTCITFKVKESGNSKQASGTLPTRNIRAIARLENEALHQRSLTDRISDSVTRFAGSSVFILLHIMWFTVWIILNLGRVHGIHPFDPFPFTFLTMVVSLEAIFLSIFVLISQNRMAHQADRRAHLDLQINLLAEQENTMMLRMLESLCERQGIKAESLKEEIQALFEKTDVHALMRELEKQLPDE
jgi:uncharacterized membrane protein